MTDALGSQRDSLILRFGALVFFTLVALYFSIMLRNVYEGFLILRYGQRTQAVVIKKSFQSYNDEDGRHTIPTVEYEYEVVGFHGKPERFVGHDSAPRELYDSLASGSTITILYVPSRPFVSGIAWEGNRTDIGSLAFWAIVSPLLLAVTIWSAIKCLQGKPPTT
jgi:uncharacterized protein DUF3592